MRKINLLGIIKLERHLKKRKENKYDLINIH